MRPRRASAQKNTFFAELGAGLCRRISYRLENLGNKFGVFARLGLSIFFTQFRVCSTLHAE